ncbi:MAG: (2Fe-2S)-binding protein [Firmicutes bacterium]|nr:(2Fe-2S)-binding protein [Bacillota bacterium]
MSREGNVMSGQRINMRINGRDYTLIPGKDFEVTETLSELLRERLGFTGVRLSCKQGACGACTVLLNGRSVLSCMMLAVEADGCEITTIEGLPADDPVILAFANETDPGYGTAMQCGFCTPGFVLETKSLLSENPHPTREEIRDGLSGHVCRCGVYQGIEHAVEKVAQAISEEGK